MTLEDRVREVIGKGFTERQARFLVTVMRHSGVCMIRQYCAFAGLVYGQNSRDFFARLIARKLATASESIHSRARVYHVHHRALYEAIGEPHSRLRKPVTLARAVENIMILDAVLERPDLTWLATEREKVTHFAHEVGSVIRREAFPHLIFGSGQETTVRYFPDRLPVGVKPSGSEHVFLYLVTRQVPVDFRPFLLRHAELLRALPSWTLQLLVPSHFDNATDAYVSAARQELGSPLRPAVVEELRWYFTERRRLEGAGGESTDRVRYQRLRRGFGAPRYTVLYRTWNHVGEQAVAALESRVLADAMERGTGRIEWRELPRPYLHLSPLVGTA